MANKKRIKLPLNRGLVSFLLTAIYAVVLIKIFRFIDENDTFSKHTNFEVLVLIILTFSVFGVYYLTYNMKFIEFLDDENRKSDLKHKGYFSYDANGLKYKPRGVIASLINRKKNPIIEIKWKDIAIVTLSKRQIYAVDQIVMDITTDTNEYTLTEDTPGWHFLLAQLEQNFAIDRLSKKLYDIAFGTDDKQVVLYEREK